MTSVTSQQWREWVQANDSDDPLITLLEITHHSLSEPIRVSSDMTQFIKMHEELQEPIYGTFSNGVAYYANPFRISLPDTPNDSSTPTASITIDNVDQLYVEAVRNLDTAPTFLVKMVFASTPDVIEKELPPMLLTNIKMDVGTISGELRPDDFRAEPFPSLKFYPSSFAGLF